MHTLSHLQALLLESCGVVYMSTLLLPSGGPPRLNTVLEAGATGGVAGSSNGEVSAVLAGVASVLVPAVCAA
jgi:hypothetical protein